MNNMDNKVVALRPIDREFLRLPAFSKIAKNLYIGGMPRGTVDPRFGTVVKLAPGWYATTPGVVKIEFVFNDEFLPGRTGFPISRFTELAKQVNTARRQGDVLVHCAMGLNRSGLIAGLALVEDGVKPEQALKMLRSRRSSWALSNDNFESILLTGKEITKQKLVARYGNAILEQEVRLAA